MKAYGKELILDLHNCDSSKFNEVDLTKFFAELCDLIGMSAEQLNFWVYDDPIEKAAAPPHLKGTSGVQFISTSNITIHALDDMKCVYLNIFSCKSFKSTIVKEFCEAWFDGDIVNAVALTRI